LGSGASGTVYEAICCRTKKLFALKVLNPIGYKQMSPYQLSSAGILSRSHEVDDIRANFEISEKMFGGYLIFPPNNITQVSSVEKVEA